MTTNSMIDQQTDRPLSKYITLVIYIVQQVQASSSGSARSIKMVPSTWGKGRVSGPRKKKKMAGSNERGRERKRKRRDRKDEEKERKTIVKHKDERHHSYHRRTPGSTDVHRLCTCWAPDLGVLHLDTSSTPSFACTPLELDPPQNL